MSDTADSTPKKTSRFKAFFSRRAAPTEVDDAPSEETVVNEGLEKSRSGLLAKIGHAFKGNFDLDDELFDDLEDALVSSDVGMEASIELVNDLRVKIKQDKLQTAEEVVSGLAHVVAGALSPAQQDWTPNATPYVIMMVGVNGVGKTTTTAKIAKLLADQGHSVMLAAADTFRAAAVEQLQAWGKQLEIPVIAQAHGADAAAVAHDAYTAALARNADVLIIDTAGRLHTQSDLMEQLQKVKRVLSKIDADAPHEVMQVVDAGTGQNALTQIEAFQAMVDVSSVCMTKLDGSARGGMALAITNKFKLPIRFIGVGERFSDLKPFDARQFADALIPSLDDIEGQG